MEKRRYFVRRVLYSLLTIFVVASFNFVLFRILPGDPARLLAPEAKLDKKTLEEQKRIFHLDKPLWQQFGLYWRDLARFQLGMSFRSKKPVSEVVVHRIGPTLLVSGVGIVLAMLVGYTAGIYAGWYRGRRVDSILTNASMLAYSVPIFWTGMIFIMVFCAKLGWFPSGRLETPGTVYASWSEHLVSVLRHMALPVLTFTTALMGGFQLIMRSSLTGVMKEDYVLTARAKGLSKNAVLWKHGVRSALLPMATLTMMNLGLVLTGAIVTETVFNWPGLGRLAYDSLMQRDYPVMQAVFLLSGVAVIVANLIADIMYYYLDPRVKV